MISYLFISLHTEKRILIFASIQKLCLRTKNVFPCNNRNMWFARRDCVLPGERRRGPVRLMVEVRLSPTCAFLSCSAGREQRERVFVVETLRDASVRHIHGSVAQAQLSWSPLMLRGFFVFFVSAQKRSELYIVSIKWHFLKAPTQYFSCHSKKHKG